MENKSMFAVVVVFELEAEEADRFLPLMLENAATSLSVEEGCHQFDVATDQSRPGEVFLYEVYSNAEAFEAHLATDHFEAFSAATASMIRNKEMKTFRQVAR